MSGPGQSPKIHGTTTTTAATATAPASKSATISIVESKPNVVQYTTYGDSEVKAAIALCRRMVELGYDPDTKLDLPALGLTTLERVI